MRCRTISAGAFLLLASALASAVTWQMDSGPFNWLGTGIVQKTSSAGIADHFSCRLLPGKRVSFHFNLPRDISKGRLFIYSLHGALLYSTAVTSRDNPVLWTCSGSQISAGMLVAVLKFGLIEKKTHRPLNR